MWKVAKNRMKSVFLRGKASSNSWWKTCAPFRVAFTWGKILAGTLWGRGSTAFPGGKAPGGKVDESRAARCTSGKLTERMIEFVCVHVGPRLPRCLLVYQNAAKL